MVQYAMANYSNVSGVRVTKWPVDSDEIEWEDEGATIEEMFFEGSRGRVNISVTTDEGLVSISVPVQHRPDWNEFVESLPYTPDA